MTTTVRPRVSPLWHRLGFIHTPAEHGEPESYTRHIKVKDHTIKLAIDVNLDGTTSTWLYDPPQKMKDDECVIHKLDRRGTDDWWVFHYHGKSPATFEEAFSSFCHHAENLL